LLINHLLIDGEFGKRTEADFILIGCGAAGYINEWTLREWSLFSIRNRKWAKFGK